jgi:hypothetical protein
MVGGAFLPWRHALARIASGPSHPFSGDVCKVNVARDDLYPVK